MFHRLLELLTGPKRPDARAIFNEYRAALEEHVAPLGFTKAREEVYPTGAVLLFGRQNLEIGLTLDEREGECVLRAESGNIRKYVDENGHLVTQLFDVYLPLSDTPESKARFLEELKHWLREHHG